MGDFMKQLAMLFMAFAILSADVALACGSHGPCGPVVGYGYGYGGPVIGPRPWLVGGGAVAFRRSRRLARRANRAAFFGFYGRANRLAFRSQAAFNRGLFRNARFNGFF